MSSVPIGVPEPFSVIALGPDLTPAGGVSVIYTVVRQTASSSIRRQLLTTTSEG